MYELTIEYLPGRNRVTFPRNQRQLRQAIQEAKEFGQSGDFTDIEHEPTPACAGFETVAARLNR